MEIYIPERHIVKVGDFHECMAKLVEGSVQPTQSQRESDNNLTFIERYSLDPEEEKLFSVQSPIDFKFWREIRVIDPRSPELLVDPTIEMMEESGLATSNAVKEAARSLRKISKQEQITSAAFLGDYKMDPDEVGGAQALAYFLPLTAVLDRFRDVFLDVLKESGVLPYRIIMRRNVHTRVMFYKSLALQFVAEWAKHHLNSGVESEEDNVVMQYPHYQMFHRQYGMEFSNPYSLKEAFTMVNLDHSPSALREGIIHFKRGLGQMAQCPNPNQLAGNTDRLLVLDHISETSDTVK